MDSQPPEHRKRVKHYDHAGHAHFLTFSCYQRLPLLSKPRTCKWFIDALETTRQKHHFDLWAWVIMPEHVHLLIFPRSVPYRTGAILSSLKSPVGTRAIAYLHAHAPDFLERLRVINANRVYHRFWQAGPGQDHNVYEPETVHQIVEYLHANPVRRGLTERPEDWPWSSAADWAGKESPWLKVDRTVPTLHPR